MKKFICYASAFLFISTAFLPGISFSNVELHPTIGDNMVLQRGMSVPVWGWADDGENVTVDFQNQSVSTTAQDGKWMVTLKKQKAGGPYAMTVTGSNTITIQNVLIGDVWVCSGQSNMQWTVSNSDNPEQEIANADYPNIRLFSVPRVVAGKPQETVDAEWVECAPETIPDFSAVGYYFGRKLHTDLNVPIGLIHTSWGGTPAESWTTWQTLESSDMLSPITERWEGQLADYNNKMGEFQQKMHQWWEEAQELEEAGKPIPSAPGESGMSNRRTGVEIQSDPRRSSWRPAGLFNKMIAPLIPYGIKGAIWYQGESNAGRAYQYRELFKAMITDWRKEWGQGDFPFFFVQLANFNGGASWPELREAQTMALELPNTGMAVTIDIGNPTDIHPRNKQDVGKRLALGALKVAYGKRILHSGPMYKNMKIKDNSIILSFDQTGSGLQTKFGEPLAGFEIAEDDQNFVAADAKIVGDSVVVSSDALENPVAVRYAWKDNPTCNLYNSAMLPASPFRTDDWLEITRDAR